MVSHAGSCGLVSVVLTFRPHPARVLASEYAPPLITTYEERGNLIEALGPDVLVEQVFDVELAAFTAERFMDEYVRGFLNARAVFVGYDFTYGLGRLGTVETMREFCRKTGMYVDVVPLVRVSGMAVSSTKTREFIHEGNMEGASMLLGRPCSIRGTVARGKGRGRGLGFPTANVEGGWGLLPPEGVYVTILEKGGRAYGSVTNIGKNPTFGAEKTTVEVFIIDFDGDLYGEPVKVSFLHRIRGETRFPNADALARQIEADVAAARKYLSEKRETN
jgi:riboflavin kinase/FMN adenylyltransferase